VSEAAELDLEAMLARGPLLIEWADRLRDLIPRDHIWLQMEYLAEEQRKMRFTARGRRGDTLLADLRQAVFGGD
jgi:tRNA threonylcarbamoyladenosine biosynthesis protein TsaE